MLSAFRFPQQRGDLPVIDKRYAGEYSTKTSVFKLRKEGALAVVMCLGEVNAGLCNGGI